MIAYLAFSCYDIKANILEGGVIMSRVCSICGKGAMAGNNVSHSNRKSPRHWKVNVQKISIVQDGKIVSKYVCTRCIRSNKVIRKVNA